MNWTIKLKEKNKNAIHNSTTTTTIKEVYGSAPQRIKRLPRNHIRFMRFKKFPDRLLEDGCEEFSNVRGLTQIRFAKGKIEKGFKEARRALAREGLIRK